MRILIISYYFAPQNAMGAVRPTKLAKYLSRMGHEVTVLCGIGMAGKSDPTLERDLQELPRVHVIRERNLIRDRKQRQSAGTAAASSQQAQTTSVADASLKRRALDAVYRYIRWHAELDFTRRAKQALHQLDGPFDVVFSSYAPYGVHLVAREAKKTGLAKRWIADFRDEVGLYFRWQEGRKRRYLRMLRREADVLCAASQGVLEMMGLEKVGRVLHNGFDREDIALAPPRCKDDKLRVVYCGSIEMGRSHVPPRDLRPMFRALAPYAKEVKLVYAGGEAALWRKYAADCGMEDCVENHGRVSREESLCLQLGADILLMASWYRADQKGILTGKLFEYMMMDKPIVCCMSGDIAGSGVKQVLDDTGMGFCCEEAAGESANADLLAYVHELVQKWQRGEALLTAKSEVAVENYAYPEIAKKLESWMKES